MCNVKLSKENGRDDLLDVIPKREVSDNRGFVFVLSVRGGRGEKDFLFFLPVFRRLTFSLEIYFAIFFRHFVEV